jgi:tetratricopeptide (TPR) repeat protein
MSYQDLCNQAAVALQKGKPAEAEQLALKAQALAPRDFAVLHLLGIARFQTGRIGPALEAMQAAVAVNGNVAPAWSNLAMMQVQAGREAEALASFDRALALGPPQAELHCNCGNILTGLSRFEEAVKRFDAALKLNPNLVPALVGRANVLQNLNRFEEGLADCDRASSLDARNAAALNNRAVCLLGLNRFEEALESAERSLALRPDSALALSNKASALLALNRNDEALAACDRALTLDARHPQSLCNRGAALSSLGRQTEALAAYDAALVANPRLIEALINRVTPLRHQERYAEALASTDRAMSLGEPSGNLLRSRGVVLSDLGRHGEAMASTEQAVRKNPKDPECVFNLAQMLLREERFAEGLPLYEARKGINPPVGARQFPQPLWTGEQDAAGKTIFVHWEQGLGDAIMFSRYVAPLKETGARVVMSVPEKLAALFRGFAPEVQILSGLKTPDAFDYHTPMASLMLSLRPSVDTIPAFDSYLKAEPERVARWRSHIGDKGFKVGIAWQGARVSNDIGRSMALAHFAPLAAIAGVRLISLQKGEGAEQLKSLPASMNVETLGEDFDAGPDAFLDTAAVMEACDLVISSDTAIPHLAGALGRPVWIALRHSPEWRWFLSRSDSPWYPSATLFRQSTPGDWKDVFSSMAVKLREKL